MKKTAFAAAALAYLRAYRLYFAYQSVNVNIDKGDLRGFETASWRGAKFFAFKGIPYAKPPVGDLRFKAPEEEASWAGVRDAVSHGSVCPQLDPTSIFLRGEEDCLFLNVYTPTLEDKRLPVMVWIHGGGFMDGSADVAIYGPDYFMDAGVVLVTFNYRLGALGFLSTGDDGAPGNAGMKDQVAALRWVRRNIAKFGGDPENVTLFGESAGGASVHFHLLSPMSLGLFAKAICQSGSSLNIKSLSENVANVTLRLARVLGAENIHGDTAGALAFLKTVRYQDIVRVQENLITPMEKRLRVASLFTPSVESNVKSEAVFLPDSPRRMLESGNWNKVPYIVGHMSHEGYLFYREIVKPETMKAAIEDTERFVPRDIKNEELRNELAESIREFYFDGRPIGTENITNLVDLFTDASYVSGIKRATKLQLESSTAPMYFYVFSYDGGLNLIKNLFNIKLPGASHGDDVGYLFYPKLLFWMKPAIGSSDDYVLNTMVRLWTNFAKHGNPTPSGDPLNWKPMTNEKFYYLNISGLDTALAENPDPKRTKFWDEAYLKNSELRGING